MKAYVDNINMNENDRKQKCEQYMKGFNKYFTTFVKSAEQYYDGSLFLPIQKGCSKEVMEELNSYKIKTNPKIAFNESNCIKIRLDCDKEFIGLPCIFDCEYYKKKQSY